MNCRSKRGDIGHLVKSNGRLVKAGGKAETRRRQAAALRQQHVMQQEMPGQSQSAGDLGCYRQPSSATKTPAISGAYRGTAGRPRAIRRGPSAARHRRGRSVAPVTAQRSRSRPKPSAGKQAAFPTDIMRCPAIARIDARQAMPQTRQRHRHAARVRAGCADMSAAAAARPASRSGSSIKRAAWARTNSQASIPKCSVSRPRQTRGDLVAGLQDRAQSWRLTASHQAQMTPVLAGQQFDDQRALAVAASSHNKARVSPLHRTKNIPSQPTERLPTPALLARGGGRGSASEGEGGAATPITLCNRGRARRSARDPRPSSRAP